MSVLSKLAKRRFYPVPLGDETVHVRALTIGELGKLDSLSQTDKTGYVFGCAVLEPDGSRAFTQRLAAGEQAAETDSEFSQRVLAEMEQIPTDSLAELSTAIERLGKPVDAEKLRKN